jgi:hypothetical protein
MEATLISLCTVLAIAALFQPARAQKVQLGEVLVVNTLDLKEGANSETFETHILNSMLPAWEGLGEGVETHFFRADRGKDQGSYWLVWGFETLDGRQATRPAENASGFSESVIARVGDAGGLPLAFMGSDGGYTDYELVGAEGIEALPEVELLGVHYIQVRPDRAEAFDVFVRETLHPALVGQMKGMDLLYYKGTRGDQVGNYLTIFAIETHEDREYYWPKNAPETEALSKAFAPLADIAQELKSYLVPGTFPDVETGLAAAIFESVEWTDFAILK